MHCPKVTTVAKFIQLNALPYKIQCDRKVLGKTSIDFLLDSLQNKTTLSTVEPTVSSRADDHLKLIPIQKWH